MPTIRYLGPGRFTDHGRDFAARPGSDHDLPDDQATAYLDHELFGDRWERVDTPDDAGSSTAPDDDDSTAGSGGSDGEDAPADDDGTITDLMNTDLSKHTVDEIREAVTRVELTTDEQADLMERERDGKNRTTALEAIGG